MATSSGSDRAQQARAVHGPKQIGVLQLIKGLGAGGAEKLVCLVAERRDRSIFSCEVMYLLPWKDALVGDLTGNAIPVSCLHGSRESDPRWALRLRRRLVEDPVDIVHIHSPYVAGLARVVIRSLPRRVRPRIVYTEHLPWTGHRRLTRALNRLTFGLNDETIFVSEGVRDSLPRRLRSRGRVVIHGLPLDRVQQLRGDRAKMRRTLGLDGDEIAIGIVANLIAQKRYPDLLHAARRVLDAGLPIRFFAAGRGPLEPEIRSLHEELRLGPGFELMGYVPEAARVLAACDIFCLASGYEGLSVAMMEALAIGLPIVATDAPGIRDAVQDGEEAVLVPVGRPDLLADALIRVATDAARRHRMSIAAIERSSTFDVSTAVHLIEEIYQQLAEPRHRLGTSATIRTPIGGGR